jgi:hypothetical protein
MHIRRFVSSLLLHGGFCARSYRCREWTPRQHLLLACDTDTPFFFVAFSFWLASMGGKEDGLHCIEINVYRLYQTQVCRQHNTLHAELDQRKTESLLILTTAMQKI